MVKSDSEIRPKVQTSHCSAISTQSDHLKIDTSPGILPTPGSDYQFLGQMDELASSESLTPTGQRKSSNGDSGYKILGKKPMISSEENTPNAHDKSVDLKHFVRQHTKGRENTPVIPCGLDHEETTNECIDPFQHYLQEDRGGTFTRLHDDLLIAEGKQYRFVIAKLENGTTAKIVIYAYNYGNPEEFFNIFELSAFLSRTYLNQRMSDETWNNLIDDLVFDTKEMEIKMRTKNQSIGGGGRRLVRATNPVKPLPGSPDKFGKATPLVFVNNIEGFQQKSSLINVVESMPDRRHSKDLVESNIQNNLNYLRGSYANSPMAPESHSNYFSSQLSQPSPLRTQTYSGDSAVGFSGLFVNPVSPNNRVFFPNPVSPNTRAPELPEIEEK